MAGRWLELVLSHSNLPSEKKNKLVPNGNTPLLRIWVPGDIANQRTGWNVKLGSSRLNVLQVGSYSIVA